MLPETVLLPGAQARIDLITEGWDEHAPLAHHREYRSVRGSYQGVPLGAVSTGIGMGSIESALQEIAVVGGRTVIKVGTTGALREDINCGDLIIPVAGVRCDSTSHWYAPPEFPAFAHPAVMQALVQAAESLGYVYHLGVVYSSSSWYVGQGRPVHNDFTQSRHANLLEDLKQLRVTNLDMETAGIMVIGHALGLRTACVEAVVGNRVTGDWGDDGGERRACEVATEAARILAATAR
jgi:uridine phosphorylase